MSRGGRDDDESCGGHPSCALDRHIAARVLEATHTAVLIVQPHGTISHHNASAAEILERTPSELHDAAVDLVLAPLPQLLEGVAGRERGELALPLRSGQEITIGYYVARIDSGDGLAIMFHNVTSWVKLRQERDRLLQLAAVGQVMPTLLHELKNPLASISTAIEVLIEDLEPGSPQSELHAVLGELRRMRLCFDGIGAVGRNLRSRRTAAIDFAIREALLVLKARTDNAGIQLICDVPDIPLLALEPAVVRAIVFNLVMNSIEACKPGDTVALRARLLREDDGGSCFELRVVDTGCGMDAQARERCTELFFTTKPSGTGIGLALCAQAVADAGGTLDIESETGMGTMVCVHIPLGTGLSRPPRSSPGPGAAQP